ncbi:MAG: hypothetical protein KA163_07630 [Bacteroidia bacterium]|nr:hypothetical protein [Bacteroidia bacterium]
MKKLVIIFVLLFFVKINFSATLVVEGKYQNKNVYVQNFFGGSGVGFCAFEVKVNGNITTDEVNSSAFEIDLGELKLKYGDRVTIEIMHKDGCQPKVLNMEDLKPKPSFEVLTMNITSSGLLKWSTKNEAGALPYIIEQFKWNKWVPVGEVDGVGTPESHDYSFQVTTHSGENKFRVKQVGLGSIPRHSNNVVLNSMIEKPKFEVKDGALGFSYETGFEVYDAYGLVVKKGFGKEVRIDNLDKGKYYLCYDNQITEFSKKK